MAVITAELSKNWDEIYHADNSLLCEERSLPVSDDSINEMLRDAPFAQRAEGKLDEVMTALAALPEDIQADISKLGARFMKLMQVDNLRVRIEGVTSNACKKVHADFTDLRLITTYVGPGTDYAPHGDGECCLERMPTGAVGLFKGKLFGPDHTPCLHRSPPIEGTDQTRLVLVIDTPEKEEIQAI